MTGEWLDGPEAGAGYWYESLRSPVEFDRAVGVLVEAGYGVFVEVSPHPVVVAAITAPVVTGTLRRDDGGPDRLLASLAKVFVRGVPVNWAAVLPARRRVDLPTYAFQRQRFWPRPAQAGAGDLGSAGLAAVDHPLLGAAVELAGGEGYMFTGRLSVRAQPWLADHFVAGRVLVPGTAWVEMVVRAGDASGCGRIEELTMEVPLVLPAEDAAWAQVVVGRPDVDGRRTVGVFSKRQSAEPGTEWARHVTGVLAPGEPAGAGLTAEFAVWPPEGAVRVDTAELYEAMNARGYRFGPCFRGLRAAWRRGDDVFGEAALPADAAAGAGLFGVHPALLDSALHTSAVAGDGNDGTGADGTPGGGVWLPFSWRDVSMYAAGAAVLRVRLRREAGGLSLVGADESGRPVVSIGTLALRPVTSRQLERAEDGVGQALFAVDWVALGSSDATPDPAAVRWAVVGEGGLAAELAAAGARVSAYPDIAGLAAAVRSGEPVPEVVLAAAGAVGYGGSGPDGDVAAAARAETGRMLAVVQEWLAADAALSSARLVVVTRGAVPIGRDDGVADLTGAAVWGLVRSAQSEQPGRLVLADLPAGEPAGWAGALIAGLRSEEPEWTVRDGRAYGRRLIRPALPPAAPVEAPVRAPGTVLVTGGTGLLGGLVAGHLAEAGRARAVVLVSRSGPAADGAAALAANLAGRGVDVGVVAGDVADRAALAGVLAGVPAAVPLTGVVHAAGALDDGVIGSLTADRVDVVMTPKADAAWHLHELTWGLELDSFVLFSSAAAALGSAGQGNYAAANAFLDALAALRRAAGLPAVSLAWGLWADASGLTGRLGARDRARIDRGMAGLSAADGLALFDLASAGNEALLVLARLDLAGLRTAAQAGALPALFTRLVPVQRPAVTASLPGGPTLRERLSRVGPAGQEEMLTDMVRAEAAAVLGHSSPEAVAAGTGFLELGLDSLTAVELRNRLNTATGLRLTATAAFDHPTPLALAGQLRAQLAADGALPVGPPAGDGAPPNQAPSHLYAVAADAGRADPAEPAPFLGGLYARAARTGRASELMRLVQDLAAFRPTFTGPDELGSIPPPVPVCHGPAAPGLICLPSFVGGPREYARLAAGFRGIRPVSVIPAPGFAAGEPLPDSVAALIAVHARNLRAYADGTPFVLVGHSTGGLVAHTLAVQLQEAGRPPAAVVLLDTYPPERTEMTEAILPMLPGVVLADSGQSDDAGQDAWLTAMAHYFRLDWTAMSRSSVPTLLVRARQALGGSPDQAVPDLSWAYSRQLTVVDVPGDHFTMMSEHAGTTAQAVTDWLTGGDV